MLFRISLIILVLYISYGICAPQGQRSSEVQVTRVLDEGGNLGRQTLNSTANNCWEYWSRKWRQHNESWIMNKVWKFQCNNGSAAIVACIGSERSKFAEVPVGDTLMVDTFWHKCTKDGDTVRYSQEPSCVVDGNELHVNETFTQGKFQMKCSTDGYSIIEIADLHPRFHKYTHLQGCFYDDDSGIKKVIVVGGEVQVGVVKHTCASDPQLPGRVLYSSFTTSCKRNGKIYEEGETWTSNHLKFECGKRGAYSIQSCITNAGDEISVGKNVTISSVMHQCYRIGNTVYYHSFSCAIDDVACREAEQQAPIAADTPVENLDDSKPAEAPIVPNFENGGEEQQSTDQNVP